ncbi:MAG: hypothetical protein AAFP88_01635 [Bacteroidota bacterium]
MDLRTALLEEYSKAYTLKIATYIGADDQRFAELMNLFLHSSYRITQYAARVVDYCVAAHPELIQPYLSVLSQQLGKPAHDTLKRNILRLLQDTPLPEALWGEVADNCFGFLMDKKAAIAIKVFSMTVLLQIVRQVPELKQELKLVLEEQLPYGSPGFVNRAQKVLKSLEKLV